MPFLKRFCVSALTLLLCQPTVHGQSPIRVLIYSGSNNHNWKETTPQLERILKSDPNFQVTVTNHPENIAAEQLEKVDVIVSNWNNFKKPDLQWQASARQAFLDFVKNGGGHVTVHAGGSSFNDWTDYHKIAAYWATNTRHGPRHEFRVKRTSQTESFVQDVDTFVTQDELWNNAGIPEDSIILMTAFSAKDKGGSGKDEPILTYKTFGKGRCVNLLLGHDAEAMRNRGFEMLLQQSVKFAAGHKIVEGLEFQQTNDSVALIKDGKTVWQFNYGKDQTKPYFHPLSLTDGTVLTWASPPDHPWHYGLWFSWKYINGVNYWEEDRNTGKPAGITAWDNVKVNTSQVGSANISMDVSYHEPQKSALLTEKRTIEISAPDDSGTYTIDWTSTFTAVADKVELNRTPLHWEENGKSGGGYAGLSFRANKEIKDAQFTGTFGKLTLIDGLFRYKDVAVEYSGTINNKTFGVTILDHPDNLNSPTPWCLINNQSMNFFTPGVICYGPHEMIKNDTFELRYRIIIHSDPWNSKKLLEKYNEFDTQNKTEVYHENES
jgi:type 1 glutamine amidotransferase